MHKEITQMSLVDAIETRRSVRGYLPETIEDAKLGEILRLANQAPSNCNIQPWHTYLATGKHVTELRNRFVQAAITSPPTPDYPSPSPFPPIYKKRQVECAIALYKQMGVERNDKPARDAAALRNFEFFNAPHVLFIGMDKNFGASVALDVGMYAQNLMLTLTAFGLASCAQGALRQYPALVREYFDLDDNINIIMGLSFGYEDKTVAANNTRVSRDDYKSQLIWKR